jgi:hypothetical protein
MEGRKEGKMKVAQLSVSLHSVTWAQYGSGRSASHILKLENICSREINATIWLLCLVLPN